MDRVDAVVVGAGVVGLAIGRVLAMRGLETVMLDSSNAIGTGTSSRNSEVIHAGLYYRAGSLKARLCVDGREVLYRFCESHHIAHRRCGKLLVATSGMQRARLVELQRQAAANGVNDLHAIGAAEIRAMEPELDASAALFSPSTGIVDSHGLMSALLADFEACGGMLALKSPVVGIDSRGEDHLISVGGAEPIELISRWLVNAAGLWAPAVAGTIRGLPASCLPTARYAKGNYFSLVGRQPFSHLIYPVPEQAGLGVHLTLDLAGQARFGPDVEWLDLTNADAIDYRVDPARAPAFEAAIRRYWPGLPTASLQPAYSGVRPKLNWPESAAHEMEPDFVLQGPQQHGIQRLMNLYAIESPGLTASLALADEVVSRLL